jgi:hypothetical protein
MSDEHQKGIYRKYTRNLQFNALFSIADFHNKKKVQCFHCDESDQDYLQINCLLGGDTNLRTTIGGLYSFWRRIRDRQLDLNNYEIACIKHNWKHRIESGLSGSGIMYSGERQWRGSSDINYTSRKAVETIAKARNIPIKCEECPEINPLMLSISHPNGGGREEYKEWRSAQRFYWAINTGKLNPSNYGILCQPCNHKKAINSYRNAERVRYKETIFNKESGLSEDGSTLLIDDL